jgi:hypothetical protein
MPVIQLCSSTWSIILVTASYADALNVCPAMNSTLRLSHSPDLQAVSEAKKVKLPASEVKKVKLPASEAKKAKPPASQKRRRHSEAEMRPWLRRSDSHFRALFRRAALIARVITRLRMLTANNSNNDKVVPSPRPRCGSSFCAYELLSSPLVVRGIFPIVELFVD